MASQLSTSFTQSTPTANVIEPEPDEDFLPKEIPDKMDITTLPEKKATVESWKQGELDQWAKTTLPPNIKQALADSTGKRNPNTTFEGEIVFRHILPVLLFNSGWLSEIDFEQLNAATPLVVLFLNLCRRYSMVDTSPIRGYSMYKGFITETEFHQKRIQLASAAVFQKVQH